MSLEQPQLAAVVLQIFVQGVDDKPNKLIESYKFEITYVDGLAQVRVSEEETGRSLAPKVEQTSVETMKRTFQVVRSSPAAVGRERPLRHTAPLRMVRLQVAIRSLIQLTSTFDALPERFSVNLQLRYTDGKSRLTFKLSRSKLSAALAGTPEEYQPEYFRELKEEDKLKFVKKPYHLSVRCNCSATVQWPRCTVLCIVRLAPTTISYSVPVPLRRCWLPADCTMLLDVPAARWTLCTTHSVSRCAPAAPSRTRSTSTTRPRLRTKLRRESGSCTCRSRPPTVRTRAAQESAAWREPRLRAR